MHDLAFPTSNGEGLPESRARVFPGLHIPAISRFAGQASVPLLDRTILLSPSREVLHFQGHAIMNFPVCGCLHFLNREISRVLNCAVVSFLVRTSSYFVFPCYHCSMREQMKQTTTTILIRTRIIGIAKKSVAMSDVLSVHRNSNTS